MCSVDELKLCDFVCQQAIPNKVWKLGKLNHVAIAVPDVDQAAFLYRDVLGAAVSEKHVSMWMLIDASCIFYDINIT